MLINVVEIVNNPTCTFFSIRKIFHFNDSRALLDSFKFECRHSCSIVTVARCHKTDSFLVLQILLIRWSARPRFHIGLVSSPAGHTLVIGRYKYLRQTSAPDLWKDMVWRREYHYRL